MVVEIDGRCQQPVLAVACVRGQVDLAEARRIGPSFVRPQNARAEDRLPLDVAQSVRRSLCLGTGEDGTDQGCDRLAKVAGRQ